jgi:hypothetical protein
VNPTPFRPKFEPSAPTHAASRPLPVPLRPCSGPNRGFHADQPDSCPPTAWRHRPPAASAAKADGFRSRTRAGRD